MDIDHEKLARQSKQLGDILDGKAKANSADKEVQHCLLLLTYHYAELVLSCEDRKEALQTIHPEWREDVKEMAKLIYSKRTK